MLRLKIEDAVMYSTLFRHSVTAEEKSNNETNKQTRTKYTYSQFKSFSPRLGKPETAPRLSANFVKNFCLRHTIKLDTGLILNCNKLLFFGWAIVDLVIITRRELTVNFVGLQLYRPVRQGFGLDILAKVKPKNTSHQNKKQPDYAI